MRRSLNWKLILWTLSILLSLGTAVHFIHAFQIRRNAGSLLERADRAREARDWEQALTYYAHYLMYEPEDTAARANFGLTLEEQASGPGDWLQAVLTFEQVLQRDPVRRDIRLRLVDNLIHLNRYRDAINNLQILLAEGKDQAKLEHSLGWCYEANGEYAKAAACLVKAIALNPQRPESYVMLAEILETRLDRPEEAAKAMDDMVQANSQSYRVYLLRFRYRTQQHLAGAENDLKKALELAPAESEVLLAAADSAQSRGNLEEARAYVHKGWKLEPRNVALVKALAGFDMRADKKAEAVTLLTSTLKEVPKAHELRVLLADLLIDEGKLTEAEATIQELTGAGTTAPFTDYLRARLAINRGEWSEALALLQRSLIETRTNGDWASRVQALVGQCYHQLGDHDQELTAFRRAVAQEPSWTLARFGLGLALVENGLVDEALTELQLIQNAGDCPAELWTVMARALLQQNLRRTESQRNWAELNSVLKRAAEKTPDSFQVIWLNAEVLSAQKNYDSAREILEKARAAHPKETLFWVALADLAARQNRWTEASALIDEAAEKLGDGPELRLARCRISAAEGTSAARARLARVAEGLESFSGNERGRILRALADTWIQLGDPAQAEAVWERLAREQPGDPRSRFALFECALRHHQEDRARAILAELRGLEGDQGKYWRYGSAAMLVHEFPRDIGKLDLARKTLQQLARQHNTWSRIPLLQARIEELTGNNDKAIGHYLDAVNLGDRDPRQLARLVQLLVRWNRTLEAEQVLSKVEQQMALPVELCRLGAEVALANQNVPEAVRRTAAAVSPASLDYCDHLWLGRISHGVGNDTKAEEELRQAVALAPQTPETWIALAEQLSRMGKTEAAQAVVLQAADKVGRKLALYTQARCYESMGLVDRAEVLYVQGLKQSADDFVLLAQAADFFRKLDQPAKAEPFLALLIEPGIGAPPDTVARGRRQLALVLAGKGQGTKGLALIDGNLHKSPNNAFDVRARALVQSGQPPFRRQAIHVFEETARRQPLTADERLQLARLFEADGDESRVREQILTLITSQPENPQFLAFYIRHLIKSEDIDQARAQLHKLERLEPISVRTLELKQKLK